MGFEIDSYAVLRAIGEHRGTFQEIRGELAKAVPGLIEKQLKAIGDDVGRLRQVRAALGGPLFDAVAEALGGAKLQPVVKKLDKHHPQLKDAAKGWAVGHLQALAAGAEPTAAPVKVIPPARKSATKTPGDVVGTLSSKAMGAKRR